jgi:hypothetical protein
VIDWQCALSASASKRQLSEKEGVSELSDEIGQLPMPAADGKQYRTDVATTETLLRIIQSISSPKAEPFKRWLARVGYERIQEAQDPEILIKRAIVHYQVQGRTDDWIDERQRRCIGRQGDKWVTGSQLYSSLPLDQRFVATNARRFARASVAA